VRLVLTASGLLSVAPLDRSKTLHFFHRVKSFSKFRKLSGLGALAFFEASTRTKVSFEAAGRELGLDWIDLKPSDLSLQKGESLRDTFLNLNLYGIQFYVVRHSESGMPHCVNRWTSKPVLNAGDGQNEHPTQALGDAITLWQIGNQKRLKVAFFGDVYRSRVARSTLKLLKTLGHQIAVTDDGSFETRLFSSAFSVPTIPRAQLKKMDVVICLRFQKERGTMASLEPLNAADMGDRTFLMHPGPVIVGEDLAYDLLEERGDRNLILQQAENAFKVRRLLLWDLMGRSAK
jgi:aspartate carbamoyltransferase catalytic subunit